MSQAEVLKLRITTDGTGKVKAELLGVSGGLDKVEKSSKKTHKELFNLKNMLTGLSVGALVYFSQRALNAADDLGAFASRVGLTTDELQELDYVGLKYNVTQSTMEMGLQRLLRKFGDAQRGIGESVKMFNELGVSLYDNEGQLKTNEAVINDVADAIAGMDDEAAQLSATVKLVDSEAAGMVDVFRAGSDEIMRLRHEAHAMGVVMSADVIAKASEANEKIETLSKVLSTQFTVALTELTPLLVSFGNKMASAAQDASIMFEMFDDDTTNADALSRKVDNAKKEVERLIEIRDKLAGGKVDGVGDLFGQLTKSLMFGGVEGVDKLIAQYQADADKYSEALMIANGKIWVAQMEADAKANANQGAGGMGPVIDPALLQKTSAELEAYRAQLGATDTELLTMQVRTKLQVGANDQLSESIIALISSIIQKKQSVENDNKLMQEAIALNQQMLAPQALYLEQQRHLNEVMATGELSVAAFNQALHENREAFETAQYGQYFADLSEGVEQLKSATNSWASQFTDKLVDLAMTGKASFKDLADSIIRDMMRIAIQQTIMQPLMASFGGGSSAPAMGTGHAAGGHVGGGLYPINELRPETLSMNGKDYLMMPSGTDGFVNASKPQGRSAGGQGGATFNVNVVNKSGGHASVANTQPNASGGFDMELLIDQVDSALARRHQDGQSQLGNTLGVTNGLNRVGSAY